MADRIVVMSKGRIEQLGTPLEIYNRPATRFVAGFFGMPTMNFLEGVVESGPAGPRVSRCAASTRRCRRHSPPASMATRSSLGVRSEHVVIDGTASIPGTARLLEPLGDATLVHFDAAEGASLVAKVRPTPIWRPARRSSSASPRSIATCSTHRPVSAACDATPLPIMNRFSPPPGLGRSQQTSSREVASLPPRRAWPSLPAAGLAVQVGSALLARRSAADIVDHPPLLKIRHIAASRGEMRRLGDGERGGARSCSP